MKKNTFTLILMMTIICFAKAQIMPNAVWLRHTCGYTNGVNLLGGDVWGDAVCSDFYGNSYNSGSFLGNWFTMDTVIEMNANRFYINKFNAGGQRVWTAKAMGTTINSIMTSARMKCDSVGNIYVCGTFGVDDSVYMAPHWYPIGSGYVAKYDSIGNNIWCRYIPRTGTTSISFTDMALQNGVIYLCGIMGFGTQSFGLYNFNCTQSQNGIIAKLDLNGNILAAEQLDSTSVNEIHGIEVSKNTNDVYIVGQHIASALSVDAQNLSYTPDAQNSFIIKMDHLFNAIWARKCNTFLHINQTVGSSVTCLKRIEIDQFDNIFVAANGNGDSTVIGTLKFYHRISPSGGYAQDIYLVKLDSSGQSLWLRHGGSDGMDEVSDIATDEWGNSVMAVYSGNQSSSGLIFGADTIPQWHGGLVKYDPNGNLLYAKKLQEARTLRALAMGNDSVYFATGNGFSTGQPYLNLSITQCEDSNHGYNNPPFKMVMVKFFDNSSVITSTNHQEIIRTNVIHCYPNPASKVLTIAWNRQETIYYSLYDLLGNEIIHHVRLQNGQMDVSGLNDGIYFLKVFNKNHNDQTTITFIKKD